jgi:hypothetical protein
MYFVSEKHKNHSIFFTFSHCSEYGELIQIPTRLFSVAQM